MRPEKPLPLKKNQQIQRNRDHPIRKLHQSRKLRLSLKTPAEPPKDTDKPAGGSQTGDFTSPQTGDDSNTALWLTVMPCSGRCPDRHSRLQPQEKIQQITGINSNTFAKLPPIGYNVSDRRDFLLNGKHISQMSGGRPSARPTAGGRRRPGNRRQRGPGFRRSLRCLL